MTGTSRIQQLVREGRATPHQAALLMELRGQVAARRQRSKFIARVLLAVLLPLSACGDPAELQRCDAVHEIARALCDRGQRCGHVASDQIEFCVMDQFAAICVDNTCEGVVEDPDHLAACVDACRELDCAETQWPAICAGATR